MMMRSVFALDQHALLNFYSASSQYETTVRGQTCHFTRTHYPDSEPTNLCPFSLMLSGEALNTNFIVFGLTLSGFESTIYHTRGEHANQYTTDAVRLQKNVEKYYFAIDQYLCNNMHLLKNSYIFVSCSSLLTHG